MYICHSCDVAKSYKKVYENFWPPSNFEPHQIDNERYLIYTDYMHNIM